MKPTTTEITHVTLNNEVARKNALLTHLSDLSLVELRLITYCIATVPSRDEKGAEIERIILVRDFANLFGIDTDRAYHLVKSIMRSIQTKMLVEYDPDTDRLKHRFWFEGFDYIEGQGAVSFIFSETVRKLVQGITDDFTMAKLRNYIPLKGVNTWKMYELANQNLYRKEVFVENDTLRALFNAKNKYPNTKNFMQKVIYKAISDVNERSNLTIECNLVRKNRKAIGVNLFISKKKHPVGESASHDEGRGVYDLLYSNGVRNTVAKSLSQKAVDKGRVNGVTTLILDTTENISKDSVRNFAGILVKRVREYLDKCPDAETKDITFPKETLPSEEDKADSRRALAQLQCVGKNRCRSASTVCKNRGTLELCKGCVKNKE